ncbi:MAG: transposase [Deltaproteobacteria bacterium]|nr:transposase [Deltaproteobacteria bacterium]
MARFAIRARFDDDGPPPEFRSRFSEEASRGGGIDDDGRDFPGKGAGSAGLQRQHRGPPGKVDNRQGGVMADRAGDKGPGLVDRRPNAPAKRFDDDFTVLRERREVPEGSRRETKNVTASVMIDEMFAAGSFDSKFAGADAAFGSDPVFWGIVPGRACLFR